jgi:hypothetical protein
MFPEVGKVFQSLLANPGGAAALERDFSIASNVLTVRRAQLDQAYVEMTMLLHMNEDLIPALSQIPVLSSEGVDKAIPRHLRVKEDFKKFQVLDSTVEIVEEEEDSAGEEDGDGGQEDEDSDSSNENDD